MKKKEVVELMTNTLEDTNRKMCTMVGMSEDAIEESILKSQPTIVVMMENIYDKLVENEIIK
jgi:hypothetical protein